MNYRSIVPLIVALHFISLQTPVFAENEAGQIIGPLVGHTDSESAIIWARIPSAGYYTIEIKPLDATRWQSFQSKTKQENDFCITWKIRDLKPNTLYQYRIIKGKRCGLRLLNIFRRIFGVKVPVLAEGQDFVFRTAPAVDTPARVSIAFGSGARDDKGSRAVWNRIGQSNVDAVVLLGDTPYIDSTTLNVQRWRYREFSGVVEFQNLMRSTPFWGTWDDHDFGANDSDGTLPGKENSRKAFVEYRPNGSFGNGTEGVYTKFRYGPVEVFLLDTRWWSWTGPSFADPNKMGLLGIAQWQWLTEALRGSDATFKLIACGMIWDDKKNSEKDDWGTYMHERDALFAFIGKERISGVVLIGGDIHVSRVLRYKTEEQIGYPLYEFITSPIHSGVIPSLNVPHLDLIRDAVHPHTFMKISVDTTVDPATLTAEFIDKDGKRLFEDVKITNGQLSAR